MSKVQKVTRKLRAILSADVKGYSILMADDETFTIKTIKEYRSIISNCINQYNGRVVDSPGDNVLSEFASAIDAVQCAVEIQRQLKKENDRLVEDKRLEFRIGVNIGDIVQDEDRIYGDGVNIAARIEGLADPAGICVSRGAYDQIKKKLGFGFEYMGEHPVKNISEPVRVYKVLMDSDSPAPLVDEVPELPDKPSIAVLPFANMSGDPSQEYFSDGLTEQIINGICKVSNLFVIARNSSFAYKGKSINVQQIGKELGVRYILEGSVQKAGDRVRITAQLIDTTTGYHLWSENYDRDLSDIFALQDEITIKIMDTMLINLTSGEQARLWEGSTTSIAAYDRYMKGLDCFYCINEKDNKQAQQFYKEAINLDKTFVWPITMLGFTHMFELLYRWSSSPIESFEQAEKCAEKALALNESFDVAHILSGWIYLFKRQHEEAIGEGEIAIGLNPNGAEAHAQFGYILCMSDKSELGIKLIMRAIRLNPIRPANYFRDLGWAYKWSRQYEKAIEMFKKCLKHQPNRWQAYIGLAQSYIFLGREREARAAVKEALNLNPDYSLTSVKKRLLHKNQAEVERFIEALRKAGVPE